LICVAPTVVTCPAGMHIGIVGDGLACVP
jgi:hypothetical protein